MTSIGLPQDNHLFLVGHTKGHIGASIWLYEIGGIEQATHHLWSLKLNAKMESLFINV